MKVASTLNSLLDCACVAAVSALAHFRRPDVTTTGDGEFIIHTPAEKDLIPIVLHHYPICVTYALFNEGKTPVADPSALEERVSDASLVLAVNSYKELCCMHLAGVTLTSPSQILRCSELAAERSWRIVQFIKATLEEDETEREKGNLPKGFAETIKLANVPANFQDAEYVANDESEASEMESDSPEQVEADEVEILDPKTVVSGQWKESIEVEEQSESSSSSDEEMEAAPVKVQKPQAVISIDDSSEEETIVLH